MMVCRDLPDAVRAAGVEALLVDQMEPAGGAVAEHLGIPFITVCNALLINRDPMAPPPFTPWAYTDCVVGAAPQSRGLCSLGPADAADRGCRRRYSGASGSCRRSPRPTTRSRAWRRSARCRASSIFRARRCPPAFHYVGPLRGGLPRPIAFPWDRLDGRPLVYASLGTLQNSREPLFRDVRRGVPRAGRPAGHQPRRRADARRKPRRFPAIRSW